MSKRYQVGYTAGVFDMFHVGHLNILRRAKEECECLIVGVTTDALAYARKKKYPIISETDRMEIIKSIRYVDQAVWQADMDKLDMVKKLHADAVFVGSDWQGSPQWQQYEKAFASVGCQVVYLQHTDGISSTILAERMKHSEENA